MTVAFLTHDIHPNPNGGPLVPGGCAFYRCMLPMRAVGGGAMGRPAWDPVAGFGVRRSETTATFGYKTVVLKLLMDAAIPQQVAAAKKLGQRVVIDMDDLYDDIPDGNVAKTGAPGKFLDHQYMLESLKYADTITVSTPFLRDYYSSFHPDVVMVRNGYLPAQFVAKKVTNRKPVIGWVGSVPWKTGDLESLRPWLPDFLESNDLIFHHSGHIEGHRSFADVTGVNPDRVTILPQSSIPDYHYLLKPIDIGIVPLNINDFNRAKSNIKGLEYAANGIPFVASPLPEYELLADGGVGQVAYSDDEWVAKLTGLLNYKARRRSAAIATSSLPPWTIQTRAREWKKVLG